MQHYLLCITESFLLLLQISVKLILSDLARNTLKTFFQTKNDKYFDKDLIL